MNSPLVQRLIGEIETSTDASLRACRMAEVACYWARVGEFDEAQRIRKELRQEYGDGRSLQVSVLIMVLEALLLFFQDLDPAARDRLARANLLSVASRDGRLTALTAAWLAHIDFNLNRFESMSASLAAALTALEGDDGTVECRASLVLGDAHLFCGDRACSQRWYERARIAAVRLGDQAAVAAITYNRAALTVARLRFSGIEVAATPLEIAGARAEVKSAINYQAVARIRSLDHLLQSAHIGALMLEGGFKDAAELIPALLASKSVPKESGEAMLLKADLALSLAELGEAEQAKLALDSVGLEPVEKLSADDGALIYASMSKAALRLGDVSGGDKFKRRSSELAVRHADRVRILGELIRPFDVDAAS